jgi:hypothetical protein
MILLAFAPTHFDPPNAVFWAEGESLRSHILEDTPETRHALFTLMARELSTPWEDVFMWLSERTLQTHRWDAFRVGDETDAVEFLDDLRSRVA